jgi:hypothetical protein
MRFSPHLLEILARKKNLAPKYHFVTHAGVPLAATLVPNGLESDIYTVLMGFFIAEGVFELFQVTHFSY